MKDYIRAEHKLHSISKIFISKIIILQVMFFVPVYILWALKTGTCIQQGNLFYSAGLHRNHVLACVPTQEKSEEVLEKMQVSGHNQKAARVNMHKMKKFNSNMQQNLSFTATLKINSKWS